MSARFIGVLVTVTAGLTVLYNVVQTAYNQQQIQENALGTFLSGGANLKHSYSFTPPYTGFEVVVLGVLALGVLLALFGGRKDA